MKINTKITKMLGIDLPIIGAPMFLVSYPDLVVAVSEAGGIGSFPALNYRTIPELRAGLEEIRSRTKKPIGVNIILNKEHNPLCFKQFEVCLEFKVELIIISLGTPRQIVNEAKSAGSKIFCDVTTLRHARLVEKTGADAIIAVCQGAGGHAGAISPFSLIPYLKSEINLPIIAAGSITNGNQMAAAMALGADAVYVGTRLIATNESKASDKYKQMVISEKPEDIIYTDRISGIPANWLKKSVEQYDSNSGKKTLSGNVELGVDGGVNEEAAKEEIKKWRDIFSAGHGVAQINEILPAKDIIINMAKDYINYLEKTCKEVLVKN